MSLFSYDIVFVLVTLPAAVLLLRRLGLHVAYAFLLLISILLPLLGHMIFALIVCSRPWPKMPPIVKPKKREKMV